MKTRPFDRNPDDHPVFGALFRFEAEWLASLDEEARHVTARDLGMFNAGFRRGIESRPVEMEHARRGFTLTELLVVLAIIGIVSAAVLPTVIELMQGQPITAAAQLVQGAIVQAQAETIRAGIERRGSPREARTEAETLHGIRLVPERVVRLEDGTIDPSQPLTCATLQSIGIPKAYLEGRVSILGTAAQYPATLTGGRPCLVLEQSPGHWEPTGGGYRWIPNNPTSWAWNLRAGERVTFDGGPEYTICGPVAEPNPELFINYGPAGTATGLTRTLTSPDGQEITVEVEALLLVNGFDDDRDGYADNGWDGLDNDGDGAVDELDEWVEVESWLGKQTQTVVDSPYRVIRRPIPSKDQRDVYLPQGAIIDLTGWDGTAERSRLVVDRHSGVVDILIDRAGRFVYSTPYAAPSAIGMDRLSYAHIWIGAREDIAAPAQPMPQPKLDAKLLTISKAGLISVLDVNPDAPPPQAGQLPAVHLQARRGAR